MYKIKIGSIIVMHKESYMNLHENHHCTHVPAVKVIDSNMGKKKKNKMLGQKFWVFLYF